MIILELVRAIRALDFDAIKQFIEIHSIDLNHPWSFSRGSGLSSQTILHILAARLPLYADSALEEKIVDILKFLLSKGLDVNAVGHWEEHTALHILVKRQRSVVEPGKSVAQIFVECGASMDIPDRAKRTVFNYIFDDFVRDIYLRPTKPQELLVQAVLKDRVDLACYLLLRQANPNYQEVGRQQLAPLMWACSEDMVRLLIKHGARLDLKANYQPSDSWSADRLNILALSGVTCAHVYAARYRDQEEKILGLFEILKQHGFDFNTQDGLGRTVLHAAVEYALFKVIDWLRKQGVALDVADQRGCKPLDLMLSRTGFTIAMKQWVAYFRGSVQSFLTYGLPVESQQYKNLFLTPQEADDPSLKRYLLEDVHIKLTDHEFFEAVQREVLLNHVETVRYLLNLNRPVDKRHLLMMSDSAEIVEMLLTPDVDVYASFPFSMEVVLGVQLHPHESGLSFVKINTEAVTATGSLAHYYVSQSRDRTNFIPILDVLKIKGFNFHCQDSLGQTIFLCLAKTYSSAALLHLLKQGIYPDKGSAEVNDMVKLILSNEGGSVVAVNLLRQGYRVQHETYAILLEKAATLGQLDDIRLLCEELNVDFSEAELFVALKETLTHHKEDCFDYLLSRPGINVNYRDPIYPNQPLLMYTTSADHLGRLLASGADRQQALSFTASECYQHAELLPIAISLLKEGVRSQQTDYDDVFFELMNKKEFDTVNELRQLGVQPSQQTFERFLWSMSKDVIEKLFELGFVVINPISEAQQHALLYMIRSLQADCLSVWIARGLQIIHVEAQIKALFLEMFQCSHSDRAPLLAMFDLLLGQDVCLIEILPQALDQLYDRLFGYAAEKENTLIDELLKRGVAVCDCRDDTQDKMIIEAVRYGHLHKLKQLLSQLGVTSAKKKRLVQLACLAAIEKDDEETLRYCLDQRDEQSQPIVDINAEYDLALFSVNRYPSYGTLRMFSFALHLTAKRCMRLLVSDGVELQYVIAKNNFSAVDSTPLHLMVYHGLSEELLFFLNARPDLDVEQYKMVSGGMAMSMLQVAISYGNHHCSEAVVMKLLERGAAFADTDLHGNAILFEVCIAGYARALQFLIDKKVDVHQKNRDDKTALSLIVSDSLIATEKKLQMVSLLLEENAVVTIEIVNQAIANSDSVELIQLLLSRINITEDLQEKHPIYQALAYDRKAIFEHLLSADQVSCLALCRGFRESLFHAAITMKDEFYYQSLLRAGDNPLKTDGYGHNILHSLAMNNLWDRFLQCAETYENLVYQANNEGETPWQMAFFADQLGILDDFALPEVNREEFAKIYNYLVMRCQEARRYEYLNSDDFLKERQITLQDNELRELKRFSYRLLMLFNDVNLVEKYITRHIAQDHRTFSQKLHDLCLFNLPMEGVWDKFTWGCLAVMHGEDVTKYFHAAANMQKMLGRAPGSLQEIHRIALHIPYKEESEDPELAALFKRLNIPERGFDAALECDMTESNILPDVTIEARDVTTAGNKLKQADRIYLKKLPPGDVRGFLLGKLTACCQYVGGYGHDCAVHGMTSKNGGFYVLFRRPAEAQAIQRAIKKLETVKGAVDIENFIEEIKKTDWGKLIEESMAGFEYVYQLKNKRVASHQEVIDFLRQELKAALQDEVLAQCWAWRSQDNCIVLDSWERQHQKFSQYFKPMMQRLAECILEQDQTVSAVLIGSGGQTPAEPDFPFSEKLHQPLDYKGYRDSKQGQYVIDTREAFCQRQAMRQRESQRLTFDFFKALPFAEESLLEEQLNADAQPGLHN